MARQQACIRVADEVAAGGLGARFLAEPIAHPADDRRIPRRGTYRPQYAERCGEGVREQDQLGPKTGEPVLQQPRARQESLKAVREARIAGNEVQHFVPGGAQARRRAFRPAGDAAALA